MSDHEWHDISRYNLIMLQKLYNIKFKSNSTVIVIGKPAYVFFFFLNKIFTQILDSHFFSSNVESSDLNFLLIVWYVCQSGSHQLLQQLSLD